MITAQQLNESCDLYSGSVAFPVKLVSLTTAGLELELSLIYSSNVLRTAQTWNLDAPTGVAGLGWTLPVPLICRGPTVTGTETDNAYYLSLDGVETRLIRSGTADDGALTFQTEAFMFWKVLYYPDSERWKVIREDGGVHIFGDSSSGRNTVGWRVNWGNWVGSSRETAGQTRVADQWLLNARINFFGQSLTYAYDASEVAVGRATGLTFTQASYLSSVTTPAGEQVLLQYADKDPAEYQDPHTNPGPPNAYQDRYETRYLTSITVQSREGLTRETITFGYDNGGGSTAFLGSGPLCKRLLTSLRKVHASGASAPAERFTYCGQSPDDQVTAQSPYNATTEALYGALRTVTLAEGGVFTFRYTNAAPAFSARGLTMTPPTVGVKLFGSPKFFFEADYVVATWLATDNSVMAVQAMFWDGRWLAKDLGTIPVAGAAAYNEISVKTSTNLFALYSQGQVHLYYRDASRLGEWIEPSVATNGATVNYFSPDFAADEHTVLVTGERFAAILGLTGGKLYRYLFTGTAWEAVAEVTLDRAGAGAVFAMTGRSNYVCATATAPDHTRAPLYIDIFFLDQTCAFHQTQSQINRSLRRVSSGSLSDGNGFAVYRLTDSSGGQSQSAYGIIWWNTQFTGISHQAMAGLQGQIEPEIHGSLVAVGEQTYRFNGDEWAGFNLGSIAYPDQISTDSLMMGDDLALRILTIQDGETTAYKYDLVGYDPNTGAWSAPSGTIFDAATDSAGNAPPLTKDVPSNFAVVDNKLFYRQPSGTWNKAHDIPGLLSADDGKTIRLLGSLALIYQVGTDTADVKTVTGFLVNGTLTGPVDLPGAQIVVPGKDANFLVGGRAFVSYTGTYGDQSSVLTLRRISQNAIAGVHTVYPLHSRSADNGSISIVSGYVYTDNTATVQPTGELGAFQKAVTLSGGTSDGEAANGPLEHLFFNGLTPAEAQDISYPTDPAATNAPDRYSYAKQLLYGINGYDMSPTPNPITSVSNFWMITTRQVKKTGRGAYARLLRQDEGLDGVVQTTRTDYSDAFGEPTRIVTNNFNGAGHEIQQIREFVRWPEIYDSQGSQGLNLLSPVVKMTRSSKDITGGGDPAIDQILITTWRDDWGHGPGQWAEFKGFMALNANPGEFPFWHDTSPVITDPNWRQTGAILSRTTNGLACLASDIDLITTSLLYDTRNRVPVGRCRNAECSEDEFSSLGFEPYEQAGPWNWSEAGKSIWSFVTTTDFYTGTQSLSLPPRPGKTIGPTALFEPAGQQERYLFGCWAKLVPGTATGTGSTQWMITFYKALDDTPVGQPLIIDLSTAAGEWTSFQQVIDLLAIREANHLPPETTLYFRISAFNQNDMNTCLLDDLRLSPLASDSAAFVYDPRDLKPVAFLDSNGQARRLVYNSLDQIVAIIGPGGRVDRVTARTFSRDLTQAGVFQKQFPNSVLTCATTSASEYFDFHDPSGDAWQFSDPADWAISDGALRYSGSVTTGIGGTATLKTQAHTNFAARVAVSRTDANASVTMGNGDIFFRWDQANSRWDLIKYVSSTEVQVLETNASVGFMGELIYAVIDGFVMCYAGGTQLFVKPYTYPYPLPPDYGKLTLGLTAAGSFDDLAILQDPQLTVRFYDALGAETQGLSLEGLALMGPFADEYPARGTGAFCDAIGRPCYIRNALTAAMKTSTVSGGRADAADGESARLLNGEPDAYLTDPDGLAVTYQEYISGTTGVFDYTTRRYDGSPLSRISQVILPRDADADATNYTITLGYTGSATPVPPAAGWSISPYTGADPLRYRVETVSRVISQDSQGNKQTVTATRVFDLNGREMLRRVTPSGQDTFQQTTWTYDNAGQLLQVHRPNAFDPPGGSQESDWVETFAYTFDGLVKTRHTPDTGTSEYLYDRAGRLRFWLDANAAGLNPQRICYRTYDILGRLVEEGFISDPAQTWNDMPGKTDIAGFPEIVNSNPQPPLQALGTWIKRCTYNIDTITGTTMNLVGRLWRVEINNGDASNPDTETSAYDIHGNIIRREISVKGYDAAKTFAFTYRYNNQDRVSVITYPEPADEGTDPFAVGYYYDRLGRLASVGLPLGGDEVVDPDNPPTPPEMYFAAYNYDLAGRLMTEQLNNGAQSEHPVVRQYTYNEGGLLTGIDDTYLTEALAYATQEGSGTITYFNGNVAAITRSPRRGELWPCPPPGYGLTFTYDPFNRLTRCANSLSQAWDIRMGSTGTNGYDANGNMLSLFRGAAAATYDYSDQSAGHQINNRIHKTDCAVSITMDFEDVAPDAKSSGPWSWGSNNGGPSRTTISTSEKHTGTQSLYLAGGNLSHYERLVLRTFVAPKGRYSLTCWVKTESGFGDATGEAAWYVSVEDAHGTILTTRLATVPVAADWTALPAIAIDLAALRQQLGLDRDLNSISLELRNTKRGKASQPGPGFYVDDITMAGTVQGEAYGYDQNGAVIAAPERALHQLDYSPLIGRTTSIQLNDAQGNKLSFAYTAANERSLARLTTADGSATLWSTLSLYGTNTYPLMMKTKQDAHETTVFHVQGLNGLVAFKKGEAWYYVIKDRLGSSRLIVDHTSTVTGFYDFLPFGGMMRGSPVQTEYLYTGQEYDPATGLYNYRARLYDPVLRRFYAPDPAGQYESPYTYVGNNPVTRTDPTGQFGIFSWVIVPAIAVFYGLIERFATDDESFMTSRIGQWWTGFTEIEKWKGWKEGNKVQRVIYDILYNFSRQEFRAITSHYGVIAAPLAVPYFLWNVYRPVRAAVHRSFHEGGGPQEANAIRHAVWMCKARRAPFSSEDFTIRFGEAHEFGRPGDPWDEVADKINNAISLYMSMTSPLSCEDLAFDALERYLALNADDKEKNGVIAPEDKKAIFSSWNRGLTFLKEIAQTEPMFTEENFKFMQKVGYTYTRVAIDPFKGRE